jgi:hypothetical protein
MNLNAFNSLIAQAPFIEILMKVPPAVRDSYHFCVFCLDCISNNKSLLKVDAVVEVLFTAVQFEPERVLRFLFCLDPRVYSLSPNFRDFCSRLPKLLETDDVAVKRIVLDFLDVLPTRLTLHQIPRVVNVDDFISVHFSLKGQTHAFDVGRLYHRFKILLKAKPVQSPFSIHFKQKFVPNNSAAIAELLTIASSVIYVLCLTDEVELHIQRFLELVFRSDRELDSLCWHAHTFPRLFAHLVILAELHATKLKFLAISTTAFFRALLCELKLILPRIVRDTT